jgi:hypothetical protein
MTILIIETKDTDILPESVVLPENLVINPGYAAKNKKVETKEKSIIKIIKIEKDFSSISKPP